MQGNQSVVLFAGGAGARRKWRKHILLFLSLLVNTNRAWAVGEGLARIHELRQLRHANNDRISGLALNGLAGNGGHLQGLRKRNEQLNAEISRYRQMIARLESEKTENDKDFHKTIEAYNHVQAQVSKLNEWMTEADKLEEEVLGDDWIRLGKVAPHGNDPNANALYISSGEVASLQRRQREIETVLPLRRKTLEELMKEYKGMVYQNLRIREIEKEISDLEEEKKRIREEIPVYREKSRLLTTKIAQEVAAKEQKLQKAYELRVKISSSAPVFARSGVSAGTVGTGAGPGHGGHDDASDGE